GADGPDGAIQGSGQDPRNGGEQPEGNERPRHPTRCALPRADDSTLESFTIGHTIVLSRGLIDVLPDEASLGGILAHELGHAMLGHRIDSQFAFFSRVRFDDKDTFKHFDFARTPEEEEAARQKGIELLKNSPYKD